MRGFFLSSLAAQCGQASHLHPSTFRKNGTVTSCSQTGHFAMTDAFFQSSVYCAALLPPRQWNGRDTARKVQILCSSGTVHRFASLFKKRAGALGQSPARDTPAHSMLCERTEKISALHVDGHRFSKLKLERRLRPQLDVLPACHQCNRRSGARSHGTADQRARAAAG